ncbi:hypothetical protein YSA_11079 [Pseudomonas putida ND6]|uniref:Uncharacterized protein n=1 Tax=Pseudomonas putida ND6 TaxID=231023 RepID=I3V4V4_PSEPU|nr:hypothetical protein YSA_11079 [Pseudomonas putida ND6]
MAVNENVHKMPARDRLLMAFDPSDYVSARPRQRILGQR